MRIKAFAKINLTLDILGKLPDNFHALQSIKQQISLHDNIRLEAIAGESIKVNCNEPIPQKENLAYKAAYLLKKTYNYPQGVIIDIVKQIPLGAGLGGGSADAAAVLKGLNQLWALGLQQDDLLKLAAQLGSDVPFTMIGGTALAENKGEKLTPLPSLAGMHLLLVNAGIDVSTKEAYENLDLNETNKIKATEKTRKLGITRENIVKNLHNDFELSIIKQYPIIDQIKNQLKEGGALNSLMSGSGSTVFGIFENKGALENAAKELKSNYPFVKASETI